MLWSPKVFFELLREVKEIKEKQIKMASTIDQLAVDFATFQTDFTAFVTSVKSALANVSAGGITPAQQTELDGIDSGLTALDATVKGYVFPGPPTP